MNIKQKVLDANFFVIKILLYSRFCLTDTGEGSKLEVKRFNFLNRYSTMNLYGTLIFPNNENCPLYVSTVPYTSRLNFCCQKCVFSRVEFYRVMHIIQN